MKKILTIAISVAVLLTIASCQQEELVNTDAQPAGTVRIITGTFSKDETKTTLGTDNVTPQWSVGDVIRLLNATSYQDITLTSSNIDYDDASKITFSTTLTGSLYAVYPASATAMTSCSDGNISFTIPAVQDGTFGSANICVASGDDNDHIYFKNSTAVLEISVASEMVGIKFKTDANIAGNMTVSMGGHGTINGTTITSLSSVAVSAIDLKEPSDNKFYLAVAPVVITSIYPVLYKLNTWNSSLSKTYSVAKNLEMGHLYAMDLSTKTASMDHDLTGSHGVQNGQEYVIIKGSGGIYLKWATENLAVTESGKGNWKGTGHIIGDYFQWGASYTGYGITKASDQIPTNLVIYDSFTSTGTGGVSDTFSFKAGKSSGLVQSNAPFYDGSTSYTKYNGTDGSDGKNIIELSDDVANIVLGSTWRMMSTSDVVNMRNTTYWAWSADDMGYYVFKPGSGTSGAAGKNGAIASTDDKAKALLFFPAAGNGTDTFNDVGSFGRYWFNKVNNSGGSGFHLNFYSTKISSPGSNSRPRGCGCLIRPVSN